MAFVSARIGPSVMDFENTVTSEDTFTGYNGFASESVIGKVGELPVGHLMTLLCFGRSESLIPVMIQ
jgi:hypothetical protein